MAHIDCICPPRADGTPRHPDGDEVTLRPTLSFRDAVAMRNEVGMLYAEDPGAGMPDVLAVLTEAYLLHGIESWTIVDEKGKPLPVTKAAIRSVLLPNFSAALTVSDEADGLYAQAVVLPLLRWGSKSSPPTPTDDSTSAPTDSPPRPPKRSSPSSTTTTPTDVTETTMPLLAGVSS